MMSQVGFEMLGKSGHRKEGRKIGQASSPPARWSSSSHTETREICARRRRESGKGNLAAARFVLAAGELAPTGFLVTLCFLFSWAYKGF